MVRLSLIHASTHLGNSMPLAIGLFISIIALVALCAKHYSRKVSTKYPVDETNINIDSKVAPKSPLRLPKQLVSTISNKAIIPFIHHHRKKTVEEEAEDDGKLAEEGFGEGGLWQKAILMGEKCQPPEFSGVIYYNCDGHRISELPPRSPRASPLHSFSFPASKDAN